MRYHTPLILYLKRALYVVYRSLREEDGRKRIASKQKKKYNIKKGAGNNLQVEENKIREDGNRKL